MGKQLSKESGFSTGSNVCVPCHAAASEQAGLTCCSCGCGTHAKRKRPAYLVEVETDIDEDEDAEPR